MSMDIDNFWKIAGGLATFLTAYPAIIHWFLSRWKKRAMLEIKDITTASIQEAVGKELLSVTANLDPSSYFTLDLIFPNGEFLNVPVMVGKPLGYLENIKLMVTAHRPEGTYLTMECKGFGHLTEHAHSTTEEITVKSGILTCLNTGHIYRKGDVWEIPPHTMHSATCQDLLADVFHHPPLPTAAQRPVNLIAMGKIFKE